MPARNILIGLGVAGACAVGSTAANAQTNCNQSIGPDIIMGDTTSPANYNSLNDIEAFSVGFVHCNIGTVWVNTIAAPSTQHQLSGQGLYRLKTVNGAARIEQIGQSWLLDGFCSLSSTVCCTNCVPPPDCSHLGVRCSSPDTASIAGTQTALRPKWQVNAATGAFPVPAASPPFSGSIARRLQARIADIDPTRDGGGQYFVEVYAIAPDDAAASNARNNASHRPCLFSGSGSAWNMSLTGTTQRERPAIRAWQAADPAVMQTEIDVPNDGRFILIAKATHLGYGTWHYEYAIENLNSDRSGQSFAVPLPAGGAAIVTNIGFHDVDYHSGDGIGNVNIDGTDWPATVNGTPALRGGSRDTAQIVWSTQDYLTNPNANALRYGTLYNFRFDVNAAPAPAGGEIVLGLFKPGSPASFSAVTIVPGAISCAGDVSPSGGDGTVDINDLLALINAWGPCPSPPAPCPADISADGTVGVNDLLAIINGWGPCPTG